MNKIYDRAWKLLIDPSRFCQGKYAVDCYGQHVCPDQKNAVKWCVLGAIQKVYGVYPRATTYAKLDRLKQGIAFGTVSLWNDTASHEHVLATLKELDI